MAEEKNNFIHTKPPYPKEALQRYYEIIKRDDKDEIIHALAFDDSMPTGYIHFLFDVWARYFFPRYFTDKAPDFHHEIIDYFISAYLGRPLPGGESNYVNLGFRGCAKTSLTKLMLTYFLLSDVTKKSGSIGKRQYVKVLTRNQGNARQIVTDIYNNMVEVQEYYGNYFVKEDARKREETMGSFTMTDGRKLLSGTIGMTQRGHLQDSFRPDFILFDDVEDNESIESLAQTEATIHRIDEALAGLSADGNFVVNGNYISEEGVIQWFINMKSTFVHKIPILDDEGQPTWGERYPKEKIEDLRVDSLDFYGEYMCDPTRADATFFDRARVDKDIEDMVEQPHRESAGFRYWCDYEPHHIYAIGGDVGEGIGRDASTMALWDFRYQAKVGPKNVLGGTYINKHIAPDLFGKEMARIGSEFGNCLLCPERNNAGHATLSALRGYPNIYTQRDENKRTIKVTERFGWQTNKKTKPQMFFEFRKDYNDGLIEIKDIDVLKEMRAYTTMDLQDSRIGLATRHFDLLTAVVIGYQMKKYATANTNYDDLVWEEEEESLYSDIGL